MTFKLSVAGIITLILVVFSCRYGSNEDAGGQVFSDTCHSLKKSEEDAILPEILLVQDTLSGKPFTVVFSGNLKSLIIRVEEKNGNLIADTIRYNLPSADSGSLTQKVISTKNGKKSNYVVYEKRLILAVPYNHYNTHFLKGFFYLEEQKKFSYCNEIEFLGEVKFRDGIFEYEYVTPGTHNPKNLKGRTDVRELLCGR